MESQASQGSHTSQESQAGSSHLSGSHAVGATESLIRLAERELSDALLLLERPSVGGYTQSSRDGDHALDRAVHVLCTEAHRLDLHAEEMLVALKQAWAHLATTRAHHLGDRDGDVFQHVVTTSIEVYFGARAPKSNAGN